jgi:RPA family protein
MSSTTDSSKSDTESASSADNYQRQPSTFVLARELAMVTETYQGDGDNDPVHPLLPSHAGANRVFFIGTLTVTDDVSREENDPYMKAEIVGPTGTFYVYAGQYQPDAKAFIQDADTPAYVAVTGKPKTFQTDDGDTLVRVAPEQLSTVASEDRDRWVVDAARHTHRRVALAHAGDVAPEDANTLDPTMFDTSSDTLETVRQAAITALEDVSETYADADTVDAAADAEVDAEVEADADADA